ncbi:MAG: TRM11 family SAM-dependent methyltransferase [Kineosporiaceae bacterium]
MKSATGAAKTYGVLVSPSANRVYAGVAPAMLESEIRVFGETILAGRVRELSRVRIGNVPYLTMVADELSERDVAALSNVSSAYALFEIRDDLLRPLAMRPLDQFTSDLISIQRYPGKTNEQFTKLLLNVTAVSAAEPADFLARPLKVFDPLCGRGTTLNQAMMYGFDVYGMDRDGKDFDAYSHFIRTWLKANRLKHRAESVTVRRDKQVLGRRLEISYAATKGRYRAGDVRTIACVHADTVRGGDFFRRESFDLVVADTPYGVQHGSSPTAAALSRRPAELLAAAVPVWVSLLRPGGAIGLSWNTYVGRREELAAILADNGLTVMESEAYRGFEHRVDRAIVRDLIVARKD